VLGWIPWYGETDERGQRLLDDRQRGAVEAHASECGDCRAELDMISGAPYEIDVALPDPDRVFDEITARIDAGEAEGADTSPRFPRAAARSNVLPFDAATHFSDDEVRRLTRWVLETEVEAEVAGVSSGEGARVVRGPWALRPLQAAAAAAAIFVIGLVGGAGLFDGALSSASPDYTLAGMDTHASPRLDVVFAEGVTAKELATGLRAEGLEIVSGPSSVGRYRVRAVGVEGPDATADLQVIASRLKEGPRPLALFAEPVSP